MKIKHLFYANEFWLGEFANAIWKYCEKHGIDDFYFFISQKGRKYFDIPEERYVTRKMLDTPGVEVENAYGNYFFYTSGCLCSFDNTKIHKISYGMGNDDVFYSQFHWGNEKRTVEYLGACPYDTHKFFTKKYGKNKIKDFATIGLLKFSGDYNRDKEIAKINEQNSDLRDLSFDKSKPTILFLHSWNKADRLLKNKKTNQGISDYEKTAEMLNKVSDKYNIIHKNHHQTQYIFDKFLNIANGTVSSKFLFDIADVVIAEYGGSAIEALLSDKKVIYIDSYTHDEINKKNIDARVHDLLTHCYPEDVLEYLDKEPTDEEMSIRKELRDYFFPNVDPCEEFFKRINNPEYATFDCDRFLSDPITKKYGFDWKTSEL